MAHTERETERPGFAWGGIQDAMLRYEGAPLSERVSVIAALVVYLVSVIGLTWAGWGTEGLTFSQDDPYVHIATARTWSETGVFGLHPDTPGAVSSSPLWTLGLGLMVLAGIPAGWGSWLVNVACGTAAVGLAVPMIPGRVRAVGWVVGAALAPLALTGLEHTLQVVLCLGWLRIVRQTGSLPLVGVLAGWMVMVRLDTTVLVAASAFVWGVRGERIRAVVAMGGALLGAVTVGLLMVLHGVSPVPHGVLVDAGIHLLENLRSAPWLVVLLAALAVVPSQKSEAGVMWALALAGHLVFGRVGNYFRYELFLVAPALVILASRPGRSSWGWLGPTALVVFGIRGAWAHVESVRGAWSIDETLVVGARWIRDLPEGEDVLVYSTGVPSAVGRHPVLDVGCRGTAEVVVACHTPAYDEVIARLVAERGVRFGFVHRPWAEARMPADWTVVETLESTGLAPDFVWVATSEEHVDTLRNSLR